MPKRSAGRTAGTPSADELDDALTGLKARNVADLRALWWSVFNREPPPAFGPDLLARSIAYRWQEELFGGLDPDLRRQLDALAQRKSDRVRRLKLGSIVVREHAGKLHEVVVVPGGFLWNESVHASLSTIARQITGVSWNGPRFFGLRTRQEVDGTAATDGGGSGTSTKAGSSTAAYKLRVGRRSSVGSRQEREARP